jgi:hypothetical protein
MRDETVALLSGTPVVLLDTISGIASRHAGAIIVCGSHGGAISAAFAQLHPPALVVFNDAGGGKADGGVAAAAILESARIPCALVSHRSARIGDAEDAWREGILSRVNAPAFARGVRTGQDVRAAVTSFIGCGDTAAQEKRRNHAT